MVFTARCYAKRGYLADRTDTRNMIGSWHVDTSACVSVCNVVHFDARDRCSRLKVVPLAVFLKGNFLLHFFAVRVTVTVITV